MRRIANEALRDMKSPVRFVMYHLHEALVNVAPENRERFDKEYADFTLEYVDTHEWICNTDTKGRHIRLSRRVVEMMWVASYSYITYYTKVIQKVRPTTKQIIDLTVNKEVADAMRLLKWGYENLLNMSDITWPADLPAPIEHPEDNSMVKIAEELCLSATAFLLHHELAHIRLDHVDEPSTPELERATDYAAADWMLGHDIDQNDFRFIKRALGIAVPFEVITACGIYTGKFGGVTHPYSYDRMVHTLRRYITDDDHLVWSLLTSTIKLHLDNRKISTPDTVYESFYECVNAYADHLSRHIPVGTAT